MVDRRSRVPEQLTKSPRNPRIYFNFTLMLFLNRKQYKSGFYRWIHILKSWFVWFWVNLQGKAFPLNKATKTFQIQWQCSPSEYLSLTFWNGSSVTLPVLLFLPQQMLFFLSMLLLQIFKTLKECCFWNIFHFHTPIVFPFNGSSSLTKTVALNPTRMWLIYKIYTSNTI